MPKIVEHVSYNGAEEKIQRLGLTPLILELEKTISTFRLEVKEQVDSNGAAVLRRMIDARFDEVGGWQKGGAGEIDRVKAKTINGTCVRVGVEVQVSSRSDLLVTDLIHLREAIVEGKIDVGVIVVPSDRLGSYLTDRTPCISDAKKHVRAARVEDFPLVLLAIEHDGPGPALAKQKKASS